MPIDLREFLDRSPTPLPLRVGIGIAVDIAGQLAPIHEQHAVYLDLSPARVLMDRKGGPWHATLSERRSLQASAGSGIDTATVGYAAPELVDLGSTSSPGPETDLFSFGMILYELLTGQQAVEATQLRDYVNWLRARQAPRRPSECRAELAGYPALDGLIAGLLDFNPETRTASAAETVRALLRVQAAADAAPVAPAAPPPSIRPQTVSTEPLTPQPIAPSPVPPSPAPPSFVPPSPLPPSSAATPRRSVEPSPVPVTQRRPEPRDHDQHRPLAVPPASVERPSAGAVWERVVMLGVPLLLTALVVKFPVANGSSASAAVAFFGPAVAFGLLVGIVVTGRTAAALAVGCAAIPVYWGAVTIGSRLFASDTAPLALALAAAGSFGAAAMTAVAALATRRLFRSLLLILLVGAVSGGVAGLIPDGMPWVALPWQLAVGSSMVYFAEDRTQAAKPIPWNWIGTICGACCLLLVWALVNHLTQAAAPQPPVS